MSDTAVRLSWKHVYTLQEGERWCFSPSGKGEIIVIHPDRAPKIVYQDGREELITFEEEKHDP